MKRLQPNVKLMWRSISTTLLAITTLSMTVLPAYAETPPASIQHVVSDNMNCQTIQGVGCSSSPNWAGIVTKPDHYTGVEGEFVLPCNDAAPGSNVKPITDSTGNIIGHNGSKDSIWVGLGGYNEQNPELVQAVVREETASDGSTLFTPIVEVNQGSYQPDYQHKVNVPMHCGDKVYLAVRSDSYSPGSDSFTIIDYQPLYDYGTTFYYPAASYTSPLYTPNGVAPSGENSDESTWPTVNQSTTAEWIVERPDEGIDPNTNRQAFYTQSNPLYDFGQVFFTGAQAATWNGSYAPTAQLPWSSITMCTADDANDNTTCGDTGTFANVAAENFDMPSMYSSGDQFDVEWIQSGRNDIIGTPVYSSHGG